MPVLLLLGSSQGERLVSSLQVTPGHPLLLLCGPLSNMLCCMKMTAITWVRKPGLKPSGKGFFMWLPCVVLPVWLSPNHTATSQQTPLFICCLNRH